jgi:arginine exporter protein ArgO
MLIYVDDIVIAGSSSAAVDRLVQICFYAVTLVNQWLWVNPIFSTTC